MAQVKTRDGGDMGFWIAVIAVLLTSYVLLFLWAVTAYKGSKDLSAVLGAISAPFAGVLAGIGLHQASRRSEAMLSQAEAASEQADTAAKQLDHAMKRSEELTERELENSKMERERADRESQKLSDDKFFEATKRLASTSLAENISAIYVLGALGSSDPQRQQIIANVMCQVVRSRMPSSMPAPDYPCPKESPITSMAELDAGPNMVCVDEDCQLILNIVTQPQWGAKVDLSGSDLSHLRMEGARLHDAKLVRADLSKTILFGADFRMADLRYATLDDARMVGARLGGAIICEANLRGSKLIGAKMQGAQLFQSKLIGADLSRADLDHALMSGTDLSFANLSNTTLANADLVGAVLSSTDLRESDITIGQVLSSAKWDRGTKWPAEIGAFLDLHESLESKPGVEALTSLLNAACLEFPRDAEVTRLLKHRGEWK